MPTGAEVLQALYGTWRFARLDRGAMRYFNLSHEGLWRSFWSAAFAYPLFILLILLRIDEETAANSSLLYILLVQTIAYIVGWAAFLLIVIEFCRWLGREEKGFEFIVAYNWWQVPQNAVLFVSGLLIKFILPATLGPSLDLVATVAILGGEWFIALVAIGAGAWIATSVVLIDIAIGSLVVMIATRLY